MPLIACQLWRKASPLLTRRPKNFLCVPLRWIYPFVVIKKAVQPNALARRHTHWWKGNRSKFSFSKAHTHWLKWKSSKSPSKSSMQFFFFQLYANNKREPLLSCSEASSFLIQWPTKDFFHTAHLSIRRGQKGRPLAPLVLAIAECFEHLVGDLTTECGWFSPMLIMKAYEDKNQQVRLYRLSRAFPFERWNFQPSHQFLHRVRALLLFTFGGFSPYMQHQAWQ